MALKFVFQEKGGSDTFTIDNVTGNRYSKKESKTNTDYKVTAIATGTHTVAKENSDIELNWPHQVQR